jgi:phospholipid N-methyltransferase
MSTRKIPRRYGLFLREALRSVRSVASLVPSSGPLCRAMLANIDFAAARTIVELGPGTGAVTAEILARMRPDARIYAVEINPVFVAHIRSTFHDRRLVVIEGSATHLSHDSGLRPGSVNAVVSSLGLSCMPERTRMDILRQAQRCLGDGGVLNQYQYLAASLSCSVRGLLACFFDRVESSRILRNCPPATVFRCSRRPSIQLAAIWPAAREESLRR